MGLSAGIIVGFNLGLMMFIGRIVGLIRVVWEFGCRAECTLDYSVLFVVGICTVG